MIKFHSLQSIIVASLNDEYMENLKVHFTNIVPHARFSPAYKSGNWDGKIRFLDRKGILPRGLVDEAYDILNKWDVKIDIREGLEKEEIDNSDFEDVIRRELIEKQGEGIYMEPWEHQWEASKELVKAKRGLVKAATSAGKSYIITMLAKYLQYKKYAKKVLLVVPRTDLVVQMSQDAEEYGYSRDDIGMYFGRVKDADKDYVISTWQSLQNVKEREFFEQFDCLIIDECHGAKMGDNKSKSKRENSGTVMRQICDKCVNAEWRFGCTGTLPTDEIDVRTIVSGLGPLVYSVTAAQLMKKGHVSQLKIIIPFLNYDKKMIKTMMADNLLEQGITEDTPKNEINATAKFNAEKQIIENYIPRLKLIGKIAKSRLAKEENVLILANTLNFGEKLVKVIEYICKDKLNEVYYISGKMDEYERKEIREKMENGVRIVVIATTSLFSTGISVKNLHNVIFGNMGKSKIVTLQAIGRALRQHVSKKCARVYDLCDNLKYNSKHAQERMNYYADEEFDIKIEELTI
jgi:superfamily II DNA or RNA helicase